MNPNNITDLKRFKVRKQIKKLIPIWCKKPQAITEEVLDKIVDELIANQINNPPTKVIQTLDENPEEKRT